MVQVPSGAVERSAQRSVFDWEMLNPMSRVRDYTYSAQLGFRVALRAFGARLAIDGIAFVTTGNPEYY